MTGPLLTVQVRYEDDIVNARQRARHIAMLLGFDPTEQTRIATAVSEIARNAYAYGGGGRVEYAIEGSAAPQLLIVRVIDQGPGIANLDDVLGGRYKSPTGMGLGIVGSRRLMDQFSLESSPRGTAVSLKKILPRRAKLFTASELSKLSEALATHRPTGPVEEVQQQNQELLRTLDVLRMRNDELEQVNRELEDTNRGVVALYAELDERADHLRRADELKTRFLSNMTHEFRTPVNSIIALTALLAERLGTPGDQKDEVYYIRKSANQLAEIVDDLLDIAKVEAGKIEVRPAPFEVTGLFGALRGMLRPLLVNQSLSLVFEDPENLPPMFSDESKVSQILRNFISNALKYTERGEVRVSARLTADRTAVEFSVADTGIGIPEKDLTRVFEEFVQIENPLQRRVKGTGLGLPLSKRLAELLRGQVAVVSELGVGSTFMVTIPLIFSEGGATAPAPVDPGRCPVLVVEDSDEDLLMYERSLASSRYQVLAARSIAAASAIIASVRPAAIVLDIRLHGSDSWDWLAKVKRDEATASVPLIVVSTVDDRRKGLALGADAYAVKPIDREWLLQTLDSLVPGKTAVRVLSVDDEEASRYIVRELLKDPGHAVSEAVSGAQGVRRARELAPDVILLDLQLTDTNGYDVLARLRQEASTAQIPIVILTSLRLSADDRQRLSGAAAVLSKSELTRERLRGAIAAALGSRQEASA
jgi:signal transduction histidine kinase/DNA-binding response OmpR family regulator